LPTEPAGPLRTVTPADVEQAIQAVARGEGTALPLSEGLHPIQVAPSVREVFQRTGLDDTQLQRIYDYLGAQFSSPESVARLPRWSERTDAVLCMDGRLVGKTGHLFTFVLVIGPESTVILAACEHRRHSHA
jgi:hypothetical protein